MDQIKKRKLHDFWVFPNTFFLPIWPIENKKVDIWFFCNSCSDLHNAQNYKNNSSYLKENDKH